MTNNEEHTMIRPNTGTPARERPANRSNGSFSRAPQFGQRRYVASMQVEMDEMGRSAAPRAGGASGSRPGTTGGRAGNFPSPSQDLRVLTGNGKTADESCGQCWGAQTRRPRSVAAGEVKVAVKRRRRPVYRPGGAPPASP